MLQGMHIAVVIPARNEEAHIEGVLTTLPVCVDSVVVVDDGSTDQTAKRAKKLIRRVLLNSSNWLEKALALP